MYKYAVMPVQFYVFKPDPSCRDSATLSARSEPMQYLSEESVVTRQMFDPFPLYPQLSMAVQISPTFIPDDLY